MRERVIMTSKQAKEIIEVAAAGKMFLTTDGQKAIKEIIKRPVAAANK